jgi:hypothetical protein
VRAAGHGCHIIEHAGKAERSILCGQVGVCLFGSRVQRDKLLVLEKSVCLSRVELAGVVGVINGLCFDDQEEIIGQCRDPFGFVVGGARDVFSKLCWGESMDSVEGLSVMVGDNVEDTVGPGLEWVSGGLKDGLCFFISKTGLLSVLAFAPKECTAQ